MSRSDKQFEDDFRRDWKGVSDTMRQHASSGNDKPVRYTQATHDGFKSILAMLLGEIRELKETIAKGDGGR